MRNLAEIYINEGGRPPKRPAPTDALFAEFEHANGIEFPESLKALLRFANGGHPELDAVGGQQGQFSVNRF